MTHEEANSHLLATIDHFDSLKTVRTLVNLSMQQDNYDEKSFQTIHVLLNIIDSYLDDIHDEASYHLKVVMKYQRNLKQVLDK